MYVLKASCSQPILVMQQSYTQGSPKQILRSKLFSLSTALYFTCDSNYSLTNTWTLDRIDVPQTVDLTDNPTSASTELVIQGNTLAYGTYRFTFVVTFLMPNNTILLNTAYSYVQIIPTGLAVFAFQNGVSSVLIGSQQQISLDPAAYSYDFDDLVTPSTLQFNFYCYTIQLNSSFPISRTNANLLVYKQNSQLQMTTSQTCFSSNSA